MAEEEKAALEEEQTTEEETSEEESSEEESQQSDDETADYGADQEESESEDQEEYYENEEEFLKEFDLPGQPKSLREALTSAKEQNRKMNELQRELADLRRKPPPDESTHGDKQQPQEGKKFFTRDAFKAHVAKMISDGDIAQENAPTYRAVAKVNDHVLNKVMDQLEGYLGAYANNLMAVTPVLQDLSWKAFEHKNIVPRRDLESFMKQRGIMDYDRGLRAMATDDPDILNKIAEAARNAGARKEQRKLRLKRDKGARRQPRSQRHLYEKYLKPGGAELDPVKLANLPLEKALKLQEALEKDQQRGRRK